MVKVRLDSTMLKAVCKTLSSVSHNKPELGSVWACAVALGKATDQSLEERKARRVKQKAAKLVKLDSL